MGHGPRHLIHSGSAPPRTSSLSLSAAPHSRFFPTLYIRAHALTFNSGKQIDQRCSRLQMTLRQLQPKERKIKRNVMKSCKSSSSKLERKTVERNRRMHMKGLCFKLASLIPSHHHSKEAYSQQDQLEQAAVYIKSLRDKVEQLKAKRNLTMRVSHNGINRDMSGGMMIGPMLPLVEVREMGASLNVILISGLRRNFYLCDVIGVLEEEGVEVVNASISVAGDKVIHIIHSQVACSRVGFERGRVYQRLKDLVH